MSFDRPWALLLLILPLLWYVYERRHTPRKGALLLKALAFALAVLALAEPSISLPETRMSVAVLVDTSASVTPDDLAAASQFANGVESRRGRNRVQVIPFASRAGEGALTEHGRGWKFQPAAREQSRGTDLEAAVRQAIASFPNDSIPRIVLLSDGHENRGSLARAGWLARELRVPIDTVPLPGRPAPRLRVESVSFPTLAFTGERFPIDLVVSAPRATSGTVELSAEGKVIGSSPVSIEAGSNPLRVHTNLNVAGAVEISGRIRTADLGEARFEQAVTLRQPRLLYVSLDPAGTEQHLLDTVRSGQFDVTVATDLLRTGLDDYQIIALNNHDFEHIPKQQKETLEKYVRDGGGLIIIGGERNVYVEGKKTEDALDRVLPGKLAPPRSPEGTCVVLIVDKSSSMEGRKMELARISAIGVIENLRPIDMIGVLIFDNSFQWAVPIRKAEDRATIKRLVAGVMPDGGTQIAPAIAEAFRRIAPVTATYKHIVLLTDGISEEGDSIQVARDAGSQKITISTVGLGQDVNRAYLEKVALNAKGRSYFLVDPSGLEQILLKDVMEHTGTTAVEKAVTAAVAKKTNVLDSVPMEQAPALRGYVRFISKPGADTVLTAEKDPLLMSWQYGLGRVAIWASDAKSRWAERWVSWDGFDRFWLNVMRDLLPQAQPGESAAYYDDATGNLVVEYRLGPNTPAPAKIPQVYVFGPENFRKPVVVSKTAEGVYRGVVLIGNVQGLFRIRPLDDSRAFPETGFYREEDELRDYGNNEPLLRRIAEFTGGRFNPVPANVFDTGGRSLPGSLRLWPGLLGLAIALNLIELIWRKWRSIEPHLQSVARRARRG